MTNIEQIDTELNKLINFYSNAELLLSQKEYNKILVQGNVLAKQRKFDEAIACFDKALEICPKHIGALYSKGHALAKQGNINEAFKCYDLAAEMEPNKPALATLYNKAFGLEDNNRLDEAMKYWEEVLEINPTDFLGLYGKAEILHKQRKLIEAIKAYNEVLKIKNYEDEELTLRSRARVLQNAIFYNLTDAVEELAKHCYFRKADLDYAIKEKANDEIINIIKNNIEEIKLTA